jgi:glycosyltransferase involved in cell wall biosynthesis
MKNKPLVSIVIPTKNRPAMTAAAVRSAIAQTYDNVEVIVVDGNSTDNTREVCSDAGAKVIHFKEEGDHRCAQRNLGVEQAKGKYVLIMDSDMTLTENVVKECVEKMEGDPSIAGLVIPEESFGEGFWAQCKALEKKFYQGVPWMEAARFYPRELYLQLGGYNPALTSGEDWDLSQRASEHGRIDRVQAHINHDEGKITLWVTIKKKYYYATKFKEYKNKTQSANVTAQTSIIKRYALFFAKPALIVTHPLQWLGMLVMKTGEFGAGATVIIRKIKL